MTEKSSSRILQVAYSILIFVCYVIIHLIVAFAQLFLLLIQLWGNWPKCLNEKKTARKLYKDSIRIRADDAYLVGETYTP